MSKEQKSWRKLDNAALLFSADNNIRDTRVFRFYCELKEDIVEDVLQTALERALEVYPIFQATMRAGLFWHYLEASDIKPVVVEEYKEPCRALYVRDKKALLFEVTYYKNRINFEVFHALTDGTGATLFLRELVKQYLLERYKELPDVSLHPEDMTLQDQENDGFAKYYTKRKGSKIKRPIAFQLKKIVPSYKTLQVSEGTLDVDVLLKRSRELGCSMSVLITALLICAIHQEMPKLQERKPIVLMVPVNLRKFFASTSMLNFFAWIEPRYNFSEEPGDFESVLATVKAYYAEHLTAERMEEHINQYLSLERHPIGNFVPLIIKNWGIAIGSRRRRQEITAIFSNMSVVEMPEAYTPYIERFGVFTSTPKMELCICSYEGKISLGFTSRFDTTNIQRNFYRLLEEQGVKAEVKEPMYPETDTPNLTSLTIYKWFSFACILAAVICLTVNFLAGHNSWWSLVAVAGIGCLWTTLSVGYYKRNNLLKSVMWLYVLLTCGSMVWDAVYDFRGWSVDYVFPAISIVVLLSMLIISRLQAHTAKEYMIYFLMAAFYCIAVSVVLILLGVVKTFHFPVIASALAFLVVVVLMIFKWKDFKEEMSKKFHTRHNG